jgi:hypothetical protein
VLKAVNDTEERFVDQKKKRFNCLLIMIETDDKSIENFQRMSEGIYVIVRCWRSIMFGTYCTHADEALDLIGSAERP